MRQVRRLGGKGEFERERYYLFAGMGGRKARRKHRLTMVWASLAALLVSLGLAVWLVLLNQP